ncbi:hypothetical protein [Alkalibacterium sp. AK22]|uniref:hypothetical protein n=1 Tax=Alkalibacterium sp. AK22 TaxID=1229520 RepID=UPI000551A611|nr:hypothetical protein [Alkalibacterium sp. AK22]
MFEKKEYFYQQVGIAPRLFSLYSFLTILFFSGITFTFVIPGLKGFDLYSMMLALLMYFIVANVFVGLFEKRVWFVFILSLVLSNLGMWGRLWVEREEYSLVEHQNSIIYFSYPVAIALTVTIFYSILSSVRGRKSG